MSLEEQGFLRSVFAPQDTGFGLTVLDGEVRLERGIFVHGDIRALRRENELNFKHSSRLPTGLPDPENHDSGR